MCVLENSQVQSAITIKQAKDRGLLSGVGKG